MMESQDQELMNLSRPDSRRTLITPRWAKQEALDSAHHQETS